MIETHASAGVLASLGINGWQFVAQLVNFSVVLFIMWKWVYTPLVSVMEKRAAEIREGLENAKRAEQRLVDAADEKARIVKEARGEAHALLEDVRSKAEAVRQEKLAIAKSEIEKHIEEAKASIKAERDAAAASLKREVAGLVIQATEKVAEGMSEEQRVTLAADALKRLA